MALQKEDVYETEDVPEVEDERLEEDWNESEEIEHVHIDIEGAMKKFNGRLVSADQVDFSDSISKKNRRGYGGGAYVLEVLGTCAEESETIDQKFSRLKCEINELMEALNNQDETKADDAKVCENDLQALLETLKAMQLNRGTKSSKIEQRNEKANEENTRPSNLAADANWLTLENRLGRLEKLVNGSDDSSKTLQAPIIDTVDDLRMRVQALHPSYVDGLHMRITQLLSKLQQLEEKKKEKGGGEFEEKVDKLYDLMNKWDSLCTGLPLTVQRMRSLLQLHEQAQHFNAKLNLLSGVREQVQKKIEDEEMTIFEFRQQMKDSFDKLNADLVKVDERIEKVSNALS